jgi:predicted acetyltransferase
MIGEFLPHRGAACSMETGTIDRVTLADVPVTRRVIIANLMQLYLHDFSEFAAIGTDHGEVAADGRFVYDWLGSYWQDAGRVPLTIQADGQLAGFTLVNRWSALNRPLDQSVAEFFVLRKYRRAKVGSRAAKLLFERFPGRWEVPVAWYNKPALAFWRKSVAAAIDGTVEERAGDGDRWAGTVLCFDTRSRRSIS